MNTSAVDCAIIGGARTPGSDRTPRQQSLSPGTLRAVRPLPAFKRMNVRTIVPLVEGDEMTRFGVHVITSDALPSEAYALLLPAGPWPTRRSTADEAQEWAQGVGMVARSV